MKPVLLFIGIVLIVLGAATLIMGGITYKTERNTVTLGPMEATIKEEKRIPIPPILGGSTMAVGTALVLVGKGNPKPE